MEWSNFKHSFAEVFLIGQNLDQIKKNMAVRMCGHFSLDGNFLQIQ